MTKFLEDLEKEFSTEFSNESKYQITVDDLWKIFKLIDSHVFSNDFTKDDIVINVINRDELPNVKSKRRFSALKKKGHHQLVIDVVKYSSDRFSHIVSVLCHEMIHLYDFKHGKLGKIYDKRGDLKVTRIDGKELVYGYDAHGRFFKNWILKCKKHGIIVTTTYNIQMKELVKMSNGGNELSTETPFADRIFGKQNLTEEVDDLEYKAGLEAFAKYIKNTNVEFKYIDKDNWVVSID